MKLKNESDQFVASTRKLFIPQMRNLGRSDLDRAGVRFVQQTENVKKCAFAAPRWPNDGMQTSRFHIERNAAQRVNPFLFLPEITLEIPTTERYIARHKLDPRRVSTGASSAARLAGT